MHPEIYRAFEALLEHDRIVGSVLEIGCVPETALLKSSVFEEADQMVGVNLQGGSHDRFEVLEANANHMSMFEDDTFDCVVSNATLEHDPFFWRTLAEIRRVIRPSGTVVIGVPAYTGQARGWGPFKRRSVPTFGIHEAPGDFYRFSEQAMDAVFFEGMETVEIREVMKPPRLVGKAIASPQAAGTQGLEAYTAPAPTAQRAWSSTPPPVEAS